jgi:hypothetical protein
MNKLYLLGITVFLLGLTVFISCSKDDDSDSKIVGKWQLIEVKVDGEIENPNSENGYFIPCDYEGWMKFNTNGTYDEYDACEEKTIPGTWKLKNNILTVISEEFSFPVSVNVIENSDNRLVLESNSFGNEITTYKKIN